MLKRLVVLLFVGSVILLSGCKPEKTGPHEIRVGTIAGPETTLMEVAKHFAKKCYGLNVNIVTFSDYNIPNTALHDGSIDANMFQHLPYLDKEVNLHGYRIQAVGKTFVYPMGVYSSKIKHLDMLPAGSKVAIPSDPSNEMRALLLLQKAGLITLRPHSTLLGTVNDIAKNPKKLQFIALDAAQLPRALKDVTLAVINTNYAVPAGLSPAKALFKEGPDSPYANIVAARIDEAHATKVRQLVASLHAKPVLAAAKRIFGDSAIPAWDLNKPILPCASNNHVASS